MLPNQRHRFAIPDDVAYLNCAYMSPLMDTVVAAGEAAIAAKRTPWRTSPADFFTDCDHARGLLARLTGGDSEGFAIVPSVSYGIAVAARNLPVAAGQNIVMLADQFPSNVYAWLERAAAEQADPIMVQRPADHHWTAAVLAAMNDNTAIVAVPHCHWTDGGLLDLVAIGERCRELGAALVLDLTQSLGALPIDYAAVQPDFAVAATYKWLLGPYSLGFLYVADKWRAGEPLEHGWIARFGSEDFANLVNYQAKFANGARRFDMGERSNFQLMPMAIAALEQLLEWQPERIATTLRARTRTVAERAAGMGLTCIPDSLRAGHFLGLRFPGGVPDNLLARLARDQVYVSVRGDSVRITPHVYNTDDDIERFFAALEYARAA